jgi:adenylate cyclase
MATEIERKFLTVSNAWRDLAWRRERLRQGYLGGNDRASIRVRVGQDSAWLNLKGMTLGRARDEFEYSIPLADGSEILATLTKGPIIEKTRYWVRHEGMIWEVDAFHGANEGLVVAEIELESCDLEFALPAWIGDEVTESRRYYNVNLVAHPYSLWTAEERRNGLQQ